MFDGRRELILARRGMPAIVCGYNIAWGAVFPTTTTARRPIGTMDVASEAGLDEEA
jgi:hypothetical protein